MADALQSAASRFLNLANFRSIDFGKMFDQSYFIPEPQWTPEQMPDQTGRVILITGGNAGIGKQCVKGLLSRNATVYIACRTRQKTLDVIEELYGTTGNRARYIELDLGDLASVERAAAEFRSKEEQLDVLINNAGVMFTPMNKDCAGYDSQMHINVLGHFYLTKLLLPVLLSPTRTGSPPRVVNLSSVVSYMVKADALDFASFKRGPAHDKQTTYDMYTQSKFANLLLSIELARRYGREGLVSLAINPGNITSTELGQEITNPFVKCFLSCLQIHDIEHGALTSLWAATADETGSYNGKFLVPWARLSAPHRAAQNEKLAKDLWDWLDEQVSLYESSRPSS